jgi:hypothetical protein
VTLGHNLRKKKENELSLCMSPTKKKVGVFLFIERYERKREKGTDVYMMYIHRDENELKKRRKKKETAAKKQ